MRLYPAAHQRFCFILRYDAFDNWITDSTERGSELARITPAEAIATSVPAPIAMPTSACGRAHAGASLTPSPTIATLQALVLQLAPPWRPCPRAAHRRIPGRCPAARRPIRATVSCVAGDHHHLDAELVQGVDGLPGFLAHLVGQRQGADDHGPAPSVQSTCSTIAPSSRQAPASGSSAWPASSSRRGPPTRTVLPSTRAVTPTAGDEAEVRRRRHRQPPAARQRRRWPCQRVLGVRLGGCR